jgi:hypothetical protein
MDCGPVFFVCGSGVGRGRPTPSCLQVGAVRQRRLTAQGNEIGPSLAGSLAMTEMGTFPTNPEDSATTNNFEDKTQRNDQAGSTSPVAEVYFPFGIDYDADVDLAPVVEIG